VFCDEVGVLGVFHGGAVEERVSGRMKEVERLAVLGDLYIGVLHYLLVCATW
jgi:hypothetical protein